MIYEARQHLENVLAAMLAEHARFTDPGMRVRHAKAIQRQRAKLEDAR